MLTINGKEITATEFAWDGCHKIYLVNTAEDKNQLIEYGYEFLPIEELWEVYELSCCSLRFISDADLKHEPVPQFTEAIFKEI